MSKQEAREQAAQALLNHPVTRISIGKRSGDYIKFICSAHGKFITLDPDAPCPKCQPECVTLHNRTHMIEPRAE